jgi:putative endonuclease
MDKQYHVYIMASGRNGTLYIGSTSDLEGRVWEHKNKVDEQSFSARYKVNKLVYYEECGDPHAMVEAERSMKNWNRSWKLRVIEEQNPDWKDLSEDW